VLVVLRVLGYDEAMKMKRRLRRLLVTVVNVLKMKM